MYDHASAFQKWGYIDWRQKANYSKGDVFYIYCTRPYKRVMYKTIVLDTIMTINDIQNDKKFWHIENEHERSLDSFFSRLKLIGQVDSKFLTLDFLRLNGLKSAPQGPIKVKLELSEYIYSHMNDTASHGYFPEEVSTEIYEGAKKVVLVNIYERSSIARKKCIEYHGSSCKVCGFNFLNVYGDLGADFIHVHHLVPLFKVNNEYKVDYKNDLIPVYPNCHAMLHRNFKNEFIEISKLKEIIELNRQISVKK